MFSWFGPCWELDPDDLPRWGVDDWAAITLAGSPKCHRCNIRLTEDCPSDDFCSEHCQKSWAAANVGAPPPQPMSGPSPAAAYMSRYRQQYQVRRTA